VGLDSGIDSLRRVAKNSVFGKREIDLHSSVTAMLKSFIGRRESGLLFTTRTGKQLPQSNVSRRVLHPILLELNLPKCGAHAFRRFRLTWLRQNAVPKDLEHFWMGHADEEIGDTYSKLKDLVSFRKGWTEKIGLGFDVPSKIIVIGPNGPNQEKEPVGEAQQALVNQ
jgi:integrase